MVKLLAFDLGTGGNKAALFDMYGTCIDTSFVAYPTSYPRSKWHEQRPEDWWGAVVESTRQLMEKTKTAPEEIAGIAVSGHSLGVVSLGANGELLRETTPIWSDSRPDLEVERFFRKIDPIEWYMTTGNGFPAPHYSVFKICWIRENEPETYRKIVHVIGTKDYINYKMTGEIATDFSYASGSGVYNLLDWSYDEKLIAASEIPPSLFPRIVPSTQILGHLTSAAASELGLSRKTVVVSGGVDNACMAAGAKAFKPGRSYASLGSSSWVAISDEMPLLDEKSKPYVFTHILPGQFVSALAIFSSGTTFRWLRDVVCQNIVDQVQAEGINPYERMITLAEESPVGSNGLLMNPSFAGGSSFDPTQHLRGAFFGLDLSHTQADMIRATMEGVAINMRCLIDGFRSLTKLENKMLVVGGGAISPTWRQIYADAMQLKIVKTNIDQNAAALGAAALAAVGTGVWDSFDMLDEIHKVEGVSMPQESARESYHQLYSDFLLARDLLAQWADRKK